MFDVIYSKSRNGFIIVEKRGKYYDVADGRVFRDVSQAIRVLREYDEVRAEELLTRDVD